jgi:hypothetical protein
MIDPLSLSTIPLEQYFDDTPLAWGTGFIWRRGIQFYLVTCWHVLSGCNFFTRKNLRADAGRPNVLRTLFNTGTGFSDRQQWDIKIWDEDSRPLWLVHPNKDAADIAVLPLPSPPRADTAGYPINELANAALHIAVGMEVFILGYPFAIELPAYPVWKRGSIASEPGLVRCSENYMLVDTASRPGMSGAPVIRRSWTNHMVQPGVMAPVDTPLNKFIGVYSGRMRTEHPLEAQIGLVWDGSFIDEIIAGNVRDG